MLTKAQIDQYHETGAIVVTDILTPDEVLRLRHVTDEFVERARGVTEHNEIYDLEDSHTPDSPRVRRIKAAHQHHPEYARLTRHPKILAVLQDLWGPDIRFDTAKLNMKCAGFGAPVEWHQDWAFYPHTNDDILAIGVLLYDTDMSNGPMLVTPGTHRGPVWSHHGDDDRFIGLIDPDLIRDEIARAVPCVGPAGSMSFHHVRALHGSALNTSDRARTLLLYEVAASDAWPLMGVKDFDEFNSRLLAGPSTVTPRLTEVPVRMPLPPPLRQGSIYETQSASGKSFFTRAA
jgi:ectoine hydroxylase-related dioxygenase (phytanoyl-CoA dioxygenase family)